MALKKSELYSSLWSSCDELRGGMDASQYKDYVLVLLFIKYVSDKYSGVPFAPITIPPGASFKDMVAFKGKPDVGDLINKKIIGPLVKENDQLSQSDFPDFNDATKLGSGKEMVDRLTNLIAIFEGKALDFSKNRADGDDILGDAYEYLMRHFATESGKSKGQFYTPAEVSRVMAQIIGIRDARTTNDTTVYDPTCGSGSLLLKVADEAGARVTLYGQEKDAATSGLARMNMILHNNPTALIVQGNTLADPKFKDGDTLKTFDYVVANPPFSDKRWSTGLDPLKDPYERFKHFGTPPAKQGDYAYLLHIVRSLKSSGKGACILPHGVLFRGNVEADIRRNLVRKGYIKGIVGLPANLFYGTGIPACIIVIDKEEAHARRGVFMIDASAGFIKDGSKNRLRAMDIHRIVDVFNRRAEQPKYSRMVPFEEIERNEFNLNLPRYIDSQQAEDVQDIEGHLRGGIPASDVDALRLYWDVCPQLRRVLFRDNRPGYLDLAVSKECVKTTIFEHPEFVGFIASMNALFADWRERGAATLKGLRAGFHPKDIILELSEDLLAHYTDRPLVNKYDVYQHLMDYWAETMQDDCYLIAADGWKANTYRIIEVKKDKQGEKVKEVDKGWACDLVPKYLVINRYFPAEQEAVRRQEAELESLNARLAELEEEHGGDGGALSSVGGKKDALSEWHDALLAVWQSADAEAFGMYQQALADRDAARLRLTEIEADPRVQALASAKGKVTQIAINQRLRDAGDADEHALLESHKNATAEIKEARERAAALSEPERVNIQERLRREPDSEDLRDLRVLSEYLDLTDQIGDVKKALKEAEAELDALAYAKYPTLTECEIKTLVVDDKWLTALDARIHGETDRISQALTRRVRELTERYETPLPRQTSRVAELEQNVNDHLERMGFSWD
jgi:type I restriction enzyme M protein